MYHGEWFCGSVAFVSTFEAKAYPFYGTQWHPEKNGFVSQKRFLITHTHTPAINTHTPAINEGGTWSIRTCPVLYGDWAATCDMITGSLHSLSPA